MAEKRSLNLAPDASKRARQKMEEWRRRIDAIDDRLLRLLSSRSACAIEIGRIKRALGLSAYVPEREEFILERITRRNPGPLDALAVKRVFERVIVESRRLEKAIASGRARPASKSRSKRKIRE